MTEKIYQQDCYLRECEATVLRSEGDELILDRTIFAPDSGGQPWDLGTISGIPVTKVTERNGEVIHVLKKGKNTLAEGDRAELAIDWDRRFDHMQNHLGEHILSGIFKSRFDIDNKGFHLGDREGTFDLDIPSLTPEMITEAEDLANEAVFRAVPVQRIRLNTPEEAAQYPLRKALSVDEDILVVTVPGVDCVACCCPHPSDTSQIGLIKIIGTEKYKGMTRVHFLCGKRALLDYRQKHLVVSELAEQYSADAYSLLKKVEKAGQKNDAIRRELNDLRSSLARRAADALLEESGRFAAGVYEDADMEQIRQTAKRFMELSERPVILASKREKTVLLAHSGSAGIQCGKLVKELAEGGRGGGSDTQAQAVFPDAESMLAFVERVKEESGNEQ